MPESAAFLSYAREDRFVAERIRSELQRYGLPSFQDLESIPAGNRFRDEIAGALRQTRCVVVLVSKYSVASDEVLRELKIAQDLDLPIIPVILDEAAIETPSPINDIVADLQWINVQQAKGKAINIAPVIRAVRRRWEPTAPVIAFSNLKGGVGKTTLAAHLSSCLSHLNQLSILMIDMDPQANLSQFVLPQRKLGELVELDKSALSLFERSLVHGDHSPRDSLFSVSTKLIDKPQVFDISAEVDFSELAKKINGDSRKPVYLIPGQFELVKYTLPTNAAALPVLKANFARSIAAARKEFDAIIIDLNPSSSFMIECSLTAATHVVCPIRPDKYSVQGLNGLRMLIDKAFGLARPPEILPVFNGVPSWEEDFVTRIADRLDNPVELRALFKDEKTGKASEAIAAVLRSEAIRNSIIRSPVPETPMLKAYHEAVTGGFFTLARFDKQGSYGARLARRLMSIAQEIATKTKADSLNAGNTYSAAQEA